jgi:hypothetical protein
MPGLAGEADFESGTILMALEQAVGVFELMHLTFGIAPRKGLGPCDLPQ